MTDDSKEMKDVGSLPTPNAQLSPLGWPRGSGYAHGTVAEGQTIYAAGQIGWDPLTRRLVGDDLVSQVRQALKNVVDVLKAGGASPAHLTRLTWFITDRRRYLDAQAAIGQAYGEVIGRHYPAMSVVVVTGLLEEGALVEIEATAVIPAS